VGKVPQTLARDLAAEYDIRRAVETGTWQGDSTARLAEIFSNVETIELDRRWYWRARRKFLFRRGIRVRRGSSPNLLRPATQPTLYWLDAHWSGQGTAGEGHECPLLDEIRATSPGTPKDCYLIDDARMFITSPGPPHDPAQWPTLEDIRALLSELRPHHEMLVDDDVIVVRPSRKSS
jgi:hypothetical protein